MVLVKSVPARSIKVGDVITYINPAVAALLGVGVLHEPFGLAGGLGLALILLGSWLSTSRAPAVLESELGPAR